MVRRSRKLIEEEGAGRIIYVLVSLMRAGKMKKYCLQFTTFHAYIRGIVQFLSYFFCHDIIEFQIRLSSHKYSRSNGPMQSCNHHNQNKFDQFVYIMIVSNNGDILYHCQLSIHMVKVSCFLHEMDLFYQ